MMIERARNAASVGARRCRTWPSASERTRSLHMLRTHVPTAAHAGSSGRVSGVSATPVGAASDDDGSTSWYPAGRLTNNRLREPSGMFSAAWWVGWTAPEVQKERQQLLPYFLCRQTRDANDQLVRQPVFVLLLSTFTPPPTSNLQPHRASCTPRGRWVPNSRAARCRRPSTSAGLSSLMRSRISPTPADSRPRPKNVARACSRRSGFSSAQHGSIV